MKRATKFFLLTILLAVSWVSIVFNNAPIKLDPKIYDIVKVFPLWLLVTYGAYSLFIVSYRLMTFPECPAEKDLLVKEIETAKADLAKKGLIVSAKA
jgi:dolichyl-phosphate mannosyltransferase polypeptide 3